MNSLARGPASRRGSAILGAFAAVVCLLLVGCNDPPTISSVSPASGPLAGSTQVTVNGSNFTAKTQVYIGGVQCANVQFATNTSTTNPTPTPTQTTNPDGTTSTVSNPGTSTTSTSSTLTATTPPGTILGATDVTVINSDGMRGHLKNGYTYVGIPQITGFSPTQNLAGAQETINGTGFESGLTVNFGGNLATVNAVSATTIGVVVPAQPAGQSVVSVTVTNPDGGSTSGTFTFGIPPTGSTTTTTTTTTPTGSSATITTIAGSANKGFAGDGSAATGAQLSGPSGVVAGSDGSIFIADTGNHRIRQIDSAGTISTVAGSGVAGLADGASTASQLSGPTGLAIDSANQVYIADTGNNAIRFLAAGSLTTLAGGTASGNTGDSGLATSATLSGPSGVAVDAQRNILVSDTGNNRVRRIDAGTKNIAHFAGQSLGTAGFAGDGSAASTASLSQPVGIVVDSLAAVYIADRGNERIRKVDTSGNITTIAGTGVTGFSGDGGSASAAELGSVAGLALDSSNSLYIADSSNQRVRVISGSSLTISTLAGNGTAGFSGDGASATSASLSFPDAVFVIPSSGAIVIADSGDGSLRQVH